MAELMHIAQQTIDAGANALFSLYRYREPGVSLSPGAGQVQVKPRGGVCRYKVRYRGNIAVPSTGTAEGISVALAANGEVLGNTLATVTPAAVENFFYVAGEATLDADCCFTVALRNASGQAILLQNAELTVERGGGCSCGTTLCG